MKVQRNKPKKMFWGGMASPDIFAKILQAQNANKKANQPVSMAKPNLQWSPFETPTSSGVMPVTPGISSIAATQADTNPMLGVAQTVGQSLGGESLGGESIKRKRQAARSGYNPVPVAAGGGAYNIKKADEGVIASDPPEWLKKLMSLVKGPGTERGSQVGAMETLGGGVGVKALKQGDLTPEQVQVLEQQLFEETEIEKEEKQALKDIEKESDLRAKAWELGSKDFFGTPGPEMSALERVDYSDPAITEGLSDEEKEQHMQAVQKQFERLWNRWQSMKKLFHKTPEISEQGLSQEAIEAMGRGMASGVEMMGGR